MLLVPLFLFATTVRVGVGETRLYQYGFDKYDISRRTGLEKGELLKAAQGLIHYFNSDEEPVQVRVIKDGNELELFNEREKIHLRDVKGLIRLGYHLQEGSLAYILIYAICFLGIRKRQWRNLARSVVVGSSLTMGLMLALGIATIFGFDELFLRFHLISFSNPYWQLDPSRDYLIMMFPQGFFYDCALFGAIAIAVEALALGGIAGGILNLKRRKSATEGADTPAASATGAARASNGR